MTTKPHRRIVTSAPLKDVVIFSLPITLWSGRGKLVLEDLSIDERYLPPQALASLGSKRLIDRAALKPLERVKRKMIRALSSSGLKFLTGYAHAQSTASAKAKELDKLVKEGNAARDEFLASYEAKTKEWQKKFPEWEHIIKAALPTKERISARISFNYQCALAGEPADKVLAEKLNAEASGLAGALFAEIEDEALDFVRKSFKADRNTATQRTIKPVQRMIDKLDRLSFLDHRVGPLVDVLEGALASFPKTGKITDSMYLTLVKIGTILSSEQTMQEIGQKVFDGRSVSDAIVDIVGNGDSAGLSGAVSAAQDEGPIASVTGKQSPQLDDSLFDEPQPVVPAVGVPANTAQRSAAEAELVPPPVPPKIKPSFVINF